MNQLTAFNFHTNNVRVVHQDGEPWFVARDVAEALGYRVKGGMSKYIAHVPEQWRGVNPISTPSGVQDMAVLSEAGMFFFLNRSDKPKALPFQMWLAGDVLPAIRKTGGYQVPEPPLVRPGQVEALRLRRVAEVLAGELLRTDPARRKLLRYRKLGLSVLEIGRLMRMSKETVRRELALMEACGLLEVTPKLEAQRAVALANLPTYGGVQ